jgi:hypothetical protein
LGSAHSKYAGVVHVMDDQEQSSENQKAKDRLCIKERRRKYYEENKYAICNKTLNIHCVNKIQKVRNLYIDKVNEYISRYPFEIYADCYIKKRLALHRIHSNHSHYADCYDAGMMAYLYSVHRCAEMSYAHVEPYIKKVICIYIVCALVINNDSKNLCNANGFREIKLDDEALRYKY